MGGEDSERDKDGKWKPPPQKADLKLWGILAFTVIGATATTFAVSYHQFSCLFAYGQVISFSYLRNCDLEGVTVLLSSNSYV